MKAPTTGTNVTLTTREEMRAKLTAMQNGKKKEPTNPWIKPKGAKTTIVVKVEAVIGAATSFVALKAATFGDSPLCM